MVGLLQVPGLAGLSTNVRCTGERFFIFLLSLTFSRYHTQRLRSKNVGNKVGRYMLRVGVLVRQR